MVGIAVIKMEYCKIQEHFKIKNSWGVDISAACSGFLVGLETADSLIKSGKYNNIIVVHITGV